MEDRNTRRTLTVQEAAEQLGIGRNAAYRAAQTGELPTIRVGRRVLVPVAQLERLLDPKGGPGPWAAESPGGAALRVLGGGELPRDLEQSRGGPARDLEPRV